LLAPQEIVGSSFGGIKSREQFKPFILLDMVHLAHLPWVEFALGLFPSKHLGLSKLAHKCLKKEVDANLDTSKW
jgi:hypothetical protein